MIEIHTLQTFQMIYNMFKLLHLQSVTVASSKLHSEQLQNSMTTRKHITVVKNNNLSNAL